MCYSISLVAVSSFFAQVIGFYIIFLCAAMLLQTLKFKKTMTEVFGQSASLFICGTMNILFGLVILVPHNLWVASWPVLITIVGWLVLAKGLLSLFYPEKMVSWSKRLMDKTGFQIWAWIWLLIGLYLVWMGFAQNM